MKQASRRDNMCHLIIHFSETIDFEKLDAAIQHSEILNWLNNVKFSRQFLFGIPQWITDFEKSNPKLGNKYEIDSTTPEGFISPQLIESERNGKYPPRISFDFVLDKGKNPSLVFTWPHVLMDARGAEFLIRHLDGKVINDNSLTNCEIFHNIKPTQNKIKSLFDFPRKLRFSRKSVNCISQASQLPLTSLIPESNTVLNDKKHYQVFKFTEEETAQIDKHFEAKGAFFQKSLIYLAATIRSVKSIIAKRNVPEKNYFIPVALDIRKRGSNVPIVSNQVTFLFYRITPEQTGSIEEIISSLSQQMMEQMRGEIPRSYTDMMDIFRRLPVSLYSRLISNPTKGQMASFYFSYLGEVFSDKETFFNQQIKEVIHLPSVSFPPGVSIIFYRFRNCLYAVISWVEGCLDESELALFQDILRRELLAGGSK